MGAAPGSGRQARQPIRGSFNRNATELFGLTQVADQHAGAGGGEAPGDGAKMGWHRRLAQLDESGNGTLSVKLTG